MISQTATQNGEDALTTWDWLQYGPFLAQIVIIRRCNLACTYCSEYDKTSEPVPFDDLVARFDKLARLRTWAVCLTGGEPTLHPRLPDLVARLTQMGFRRRMMITNGYFLSQASIESLNENGLTDLQISIDGVHSNANTVKVLNPLKKQLAALSRYAKFKVVMSGVLGSAPPEEALEVIEFARGHGFIPRVLLIHNDRGELRLSDEELQVYHEAQKRLGTRVEDAHRYRERLIQHGRAPFKCRAGARYLYIDEFGSVHWCSQTRGVFTKNLLEYNLEDLKAQFGQRKDCNETCTLGCARTSSAYDQWRPQG